MSPGQISATRSGRQEPPMTVKKAQSKLTDAERHKRFVNMAKQVGASNDPKAFDKGVQEGRGEAPNPEPPMKAIAAVLILVASSAAFAEPIRTQAPKVWYNQGECWRAVQVALGPLAEDLGSSRVLANSEDRIEHELMDVVSGRVVLRAACLRVPGPGVPIFRRVFEFPG